MIYFRLSLTVLIFASFAFLLWGSCLSPDKQSQEGPDISYVVVIGIDGMSPDGIRKARTPVLDELIRIGAYTDKARAVLPTSSSPNWASMIMGAGPEQHGITSNAWQADRHQLSPVSQGSEAIFPTIFSVLKEQMPSAGTAAIYDWKGFGRLFEKKAVDYDRNGKDEFETTQLAVDYLKSQKPAFTFIHLDHVDHAGHSHQHGSQEYYASVERADSLIGEVVQACKEAGIYEEMLLIISADHGGKGYGHGGESLAEIEIPFLLVGKGIKKGHRIEQAVYTYDNAATVAYALGLNMPYAWIGRPVKEAFSGESNTPVQAIRPILPTPIMLPVDETLKRKDGIYKGPPMEVYCQFDVPDASVHFTLDGSEPDESKPIYKAPFSITKTTTIKARAYQDGRSDSPVSIQTFEIQ